MLWLLLAACSGGSSTSTPEAPKAEAPKAEAPKAEAPKDGVIQIKGSDSEVNLVQKLTEEFSKKTPDARFAVTGGGSGVGIAALLDGSIQIATSSRELKGSEKVEFSRKSIDVQGFVFATDALAVIVNEKNPLAELDLTTLGAIYRGEKTAWKDVGGGDGAISLYGRQSNSGTYDFFKNTVLSGDYAASLKQMNGTAQIVEAVASDATGIGYVAAGYVNGKPGIKVLKLKTADGVFEATNEEQVLSGKYPLARPLYQFVPAKPDGAVKAFFQYEASPEGQAIVKEMGFFPIAPSSQASNQALLGG